MAADNDADFSLEKGFNPTNSAGRVSASAAKRDSPAGRIATLTTAPAHSFDPFEDFSGSVGALHVVAPADASVDLLGDEVVQPPLPPQPHAVQGPADSENGALCHPDASSGPATIAPTGYATLAAETPASNRDDNNESGLLTSTVDPHAVTDAPGEAPDGSVQATVDPDSDPDSPGRGSKGHSGSQSLPSEHEQTDTESAAAANSTEGAAGEGADADERLVDSDRDLVEEEDAFGDFADFTSASRFLPGGSSGSLGGSSAAHSAHLPPATTTVAAAGPATSGRAAGAGISSPSAHRHTYLGTAFPPRSSHSAQQLHGPPTSGAVSEHGSFAGDFSDFSHPSPPQSVAPSRAGGGRKSVASLASVGSRAGGDDDLGDYGSVVGSSVWRAPSQMATSSYAAAAGADDDFGDFTSDITSTSDFAPSTQPPSAVAVSGPGSVHPDDDFGSFASHRSTADDDEDDFGNFNAAPAAAAAAAGAAAQGQGASSSGAGGSAAGASAGAGATAAAGAGLASGAGSASLSPRETSPGAAAAHGFHSTQTIAPSLPAAASAVATSGGAAVEGAAAVAAECSLLQLPAAELRQAVARALQPLLPAGSPLAAPPQLPSEQVSAAWAQLRRHVQGALADGGLAAHTGVPLPPLPGGGAAAAEAPAQGGGQQEGPAGRGGFQPTVKFTRPLRWKGSDSERRLLASLGLSEVAAQACGLEAADGPPRAGGRPRSEAGPWGGAGRPLGRLASFGEAPRRARNDLGSLPGESTKLITRRDAELNAAVPPGGSNGLGAGSNGSCRARGLDSGSDGGASSGALLGGGTGATPRAASGGMSGVATGGVEAPNGTGQAS